MPTYPYVGGPLDGATVDTSLRDRPTFRTATGGRLDNQGTRPAEGWYVRADGAYRWVTDRAAERRLRAMAPAPAKPGVATWTYVGGPLDGRRIDVGGRLLSSWRTRIGTPWHPSLGAAFRFYEADHTTRTYRARGLS